MLSKIKAHPYLSAAVGLVALFVLYLLMRSGGGATEVVAMTYDPSGTAGGSDLQYQQMALQAASMQIQAQAGANADNNATAITLAQIQAQYGQNANELAANVKLAEINAAAQTTALQSSLLAETQQKQLEYTYLTDAARNTAMVDMQRLTTDAMVKIAKFQANVAIEGMKPRGLLGAIFG